MAISGDSHVIEPYRKKDGSTYDKVMLSSKHVEMGDGESLEEKNTFYKKGAASGVLYRYGNLVHFHHELNTTIATKNLNWQTLPEGYRPITTERQSFMTISNNNPHLWVMISIGHDGKCAYISNNTGFTEFWFDMYYFTNDPLPPDEDIMTA